MPGGKGRRVLWAALALALALAAAALWTARAFSRPEGTPVRIVVAEGAPFRAVADSLARAGVVANARVFRLYARLEGADRATKPGTYLFRRGTPWRDILAGLTGGEGLVRRVTIPEGFALAQIAAALGHALDVPPDSIVGAARDSALLAGLGIPSGSAEGYLFPDTYAFPEGTSAARAVAEMVRRFEREWSKEWDDRARELGFSRHEIVTLASIVEREARRAEERPVIAAVYHNRLRVGMPLQADPTVQYARGSHTARVTYHDLTIDSPYNTYRYPGLPPGPIASPGAASLNAALFPASVPYLYFVAFPDGRHEFRRTFDEHSQVVRRARVAWDSVWRAETLRTQPPRR